MCNCIFIFYADIDIAVDKLKHKLFIFNGILKVCETFLSSSNALLSSSFGIREPRLLLLLSSSLSLPLSPCVK